jgi:hypothetical protein
MNETKPCCRLRLPTLAVLSLVLALPLRGGDDELSRKSLRGLPGVLVTVDDLEQSTVANCRPPDAVQLRTDVELKLRKAGIAIFSEDQFAKAPGKPGMSVRVVCGASEQEAYGLVELSVTQEVALTRDQSVHLYLVTWSVSGGLGKAKLEGLERTIRDKLGDQVDKFLNAYMAANPPSRR